MLVEIKQLWGLNSDHLLFISFKMAFLIKFYFVNSEGMLQWNVTRVESFLFPLPPEWNKQNAHWFRKEGGLSVPRGVTHSVADARSSFWTLSPSNQKSRQREERYHFLFWIGDCFEWGDGRIQLGTAYSSEPGLHIHKYSPGTTAPRDLRSCHRHKSHPCMWNISFLTSW